VIVSERDALRTRRKIESRVRRLMDENGCWPVEGSLLLAVSGGPDSTALALILSQLARRRAARFVLAYFDHCLRGEMASEVENEAVQGLAAKLALPLLTGSGDVRRRAKAEKLSLEEAARRARYEFLARAAREAGVSSVATGHTASDQAETVLMHVLRGAGLRGLSGMASVSPWPLPGQDDLTLVRPLLCLSRADTVAYCRASGLAPVADESNDSNAFLRNRVRDDLLPKLREYNPRVEDALVRLADAARNALEDATDSVAEAMVQRRKGQIGLSLTLLRSWSSARRQKTFRQALDELVGNTHGYSERHFSALERLALKGHTGDHLDLPRDLRASLSRDSLVLSAGIADTWSLPAEPVFLTVPGEARFGPLDVSVRPSMSSGQASQPEASVEVAAEALGDSVTVRRRRPGDRFQPLGMQETKKLQDFFVDAHLPRSERDQVPVFETGRGIAWVGGLRIAEWAKPVAGQATLFLAYSPSDS
jgi:tRNA(Ile)-lysidine synthase